MSLGEIFNQIYRTGTWGDGSSTKPLSGSGSLPENAKPYVDFVRQVVQNLGLKQVLDVGHGDFEMWRDWQFTGVNYLGVDISEEVTELARSRYSNANLQFITLDLTQSETLPCADLLISKDCLQHLPNQIILMLLQKFSNYEHLIICNDIYVPYISFLAKLRNYLRLRTRIRALLNLKSPFFLINREKNRDIKAGDFRALNLEIKPFIESFPGYKLMETFDFDGPQRDGIKKRVYFYRKSISF